MPYGISLPTSPSFILCISAVAQHVGVLRRAFWGVTPSFHSLEYQFSIQKFCICLVSCLCSYQGTCRTHIISASDCLFLLLDLHTVDVRYFTFDQFNRLHLVYGLYMKIDNQVFIYIQKLCQHLVRKRIKYFLTTDKARRMRTQYQVSIWAGYEVFKVQ